MNKELIQKVQQGTHCIEHTMKEEDFSRLTAVLLAVAPEDDPPLNGNLKYYHVKKVGCWFAKHYCPIKLTPIPLHQFFEEKQRNNYEPKILTESELKKIIIQNTEECYSVIYGECRLFTDDALEAIVKEVMDSLKLFHPNHQINQTFSPKSWNCGTQVVK